MSEQRGWFASNWKWLLPLGCVLPMLCCLSFAGATYFGVSKAIEASPPFAMAMEKARGNDEIKDTLGLPLTTRLGVRGSMTETNGTGHANFTVPIVGPKGAADLHVIAEAVNDTWTLTLAEVIARDTVIDLVEPE